MYFLDTSIVVSLYIPELKSKKAHEFVTNAEKICICSLTEVEFTSAINRLVQMKELSKSAGQQVVSLFMSHCNKGIYRICEINRTDFSLARDWLGSFQSVLRTLDAIQLACAYNNQLQLVTGDKQLARAAKKLGVTAKLF